MRLGTHLHRIGNDIVAAYLIVTPEGITVVDAGLPGQWKDLLAELSSLGRSLADIKGLVLTHGDSDHLGFAERLRGETGVPVYLHAADTAQARGGRKPGGKAGPMRPGPLLRFAAYGLRKQGFRTPKLTASLTAADGDVLPLPGSPRVIALPGHTPGSIAVYSPIADAVFVGDALTTRNVLTGRPGAALSPFTADREEALASLDRIADLEAAWVLAGHGTPWHGSPAGIVAAIRASVPPDR